ncbi:unnamed protein product [Phytophthora lilii]|uniref:Unnamed protein product n=1 Tax=Phytophthora lilii TaxID=2077276 RepID=A0A9W6X4P6_9STRA|nr:unnamed protein product [Phytophthora lilii]
MLGLHQEESFLPLLLFELVLRHRKEVTDLATFDLVLNFNKTFHKYAAEAKKFIKLNEEEIRTLSQQLRVIRLIEGNSTDLTGWTGVSILFASPGLKGMGNYAKVDSYQYILPVWTLTSCKITTVSLMIISE